MVFVNEEERRRRLEICGACDQYRVKFRQCKKCGCLMPFKTKLQNSTCPLQKW
jgi:hypothetical protein